MRAGIRGPCLAEPIAAAAIRAPSPSSRLDLRTLTSSEPAGFKFPLHASSHPLARHAQLSDHRAIGQVFTPPLINDSSARNQTLAVLAAVRKHGNFCPPTGYWSSPLVHSCVGSRCRAKSSCNGSQSDRALHLLPMLHVGNRYGHAIATASSHAKQIKMPWPAGDLIGAKCCDCTYSSRSSPSRSVVTKQSR
ncbi:hypothetical protein OBBRIDRAFT_633195 [Obba rivulosa]|uniref:Uncharacterized protein n=1 Tax=Obba rivulosa TaxID=1052685 RepID=A0A8E2ASY4_9APHY|nr:hypothetical protein OBBRIDRAFT_633195 [Obba rivulosa]